MIAEWGDRLAAVACVIGWGATVVAIAWWGNR